MSHDNALPTWDLELDADELFATKTALLHSVRYYERRLMNADPNTKRYSEAASECRAVKSALQQVDATLESVIGISA